MNKDTVLRLALEALENSVDLVREDAYNAEELYVNYPARQGKVRGLKVLADDHEKAITAIKAALEAKDEPVAKFHVEHRTNACSEVCDEKGKVYATCDWTTEASKRAQLICDLLNTTPPQRTWVALTDEEISDCMEMSIQKTCRAIEAKLKAKNT